MLPRSSVAQTRHGLWRVRQQTPSRLIGDMGGRPVVVDLDAGVMQSLTPPHDGCWMTDFAVASEFVVGMCTQGDVTRVTQYRITNLAGEPEPGRSSAKSSEVWQRNARMTIDPNALPSRR